MAEKLKTLTTYKATWNKIKKNPQPYIEEHIKFVRPSTPIKGEAGVYNILVVGYGCEHARTLNQAFKDLNVQIAKNVLQLFIKVEQRLPRKDEKITCFCQLDTQVTSHKRAGKESTITIVGKMSPKV